jgi:hypothetical protein
MYIKIILFKLVVCQQKVLEPLPYSVATVFILILSLGKVQFTDSNLESPIVLDLIHQ